MCLRIQIDEYERPQVCTWTAADDLRRSNSDAFEFRHANRLHPGNRSMHDRGNGSPGLSAAFARMEPR